jgi:hypothetical protein
VERRWRWGTPRCLFRVFSSAWTIFVLKSIVKFKWNPRHKHQRTSPDTLLPPPNINRGAYSRESVKLKVAFIS